MSTDSTAKLIVFTVTCQAMFGICKSQIYRLSSQFSLSCFRARSIVTSSFPPVAPPNCNFVTQLYSRIDQFPHRTALVDGPTGKRFSYNELRNAVSNIAGGFHKKGFRKGDQVAIFSHNCPEFIFAAHGAIAGGLVVCPINGSYTVFELAAILKASECVAIVTDHQRLKTVLEACKSAPSVRSIFLFNASRSECEDLNCESFDDLLMDNGNVFRKDCMDVDADNDMAFLPFSSGTSGPPKGVMLTHNNVAVNLLQAESLFEDRIGKEVAIGVLPFFHIYALNVILGHILHVGGTVVTLPSFSSETYLKAVDEHQPTLLHIAPPLMLFLLQHPLVKETNMASVERIMSGGAPLGGNLVEDALKAFPEVDVIQGYGLTETSPICFIIPKKKRRPPNKSVLGSVGISVPSQDCMIVDPETKAELHAGQQGELVVRGPHVMKGYFNNPQATAECLSDGWFFTGDVGYFDEDNYFYVCDRVKELIKYKGFQVRMIGAMFLNCTVHDYRCLRYSW